MVSLGSEQFVQLLVLEDLVKNPDFVNSWLSTFVSDSSKGGKHEEAEMEFPDESLVEHEEAERGIGNERSSPTVVGSVKSGVDLINIISRSLSPFPHIILENIVAVREFMWISLSFRLYTSNLSYF